MIEIRDWFFLGCFAILLLIIRAIVIVIIRVWRKVDSLAETWSLRKEYNEARKKNWEYERKLDNLEKAYNELMGRWKLVRARKEELRHENRELKKRLSA